MKICILTHSLDPTRGSGRLARDFINALNKEGVKTTTLTSLSTGSDIEQSILYANKIKLFWALPRIRRIIKKNDIVHAFDVFPYGIIAMIAGLGLKKPIIITAVGSGSIRPLYKTGSAILSRWVFKRASSLTSISNYVVREINKKVPGLNFEVIVPGIDYNYFISKKSQEKVVKNIPYILSVAKLKPRKGHHISLRVFKEISRKFPKLNYIIVGKGRGSYFHEIKNLVSELDIKEKVFFKECVPDKELVSLYRGAEIFMLLPQNDDNDIEGFGLVFVEAAAFGLPVVGTFDSGAEDAILNNQNGFLVPADGIVESAEKVIDLLGNDSLKEKFSRKSIYFAKEHDWSKIIKKYIQLYELLL